MFNYDLRIMLVEDHPFQLKATQYLLESYGFTQVTAVDNAENALQTLRHVQPPFEILLCDQCLPDLCGLDLIGIASHQGLIRQAIILSSLDSTELDTLKKNAHEQRLPLLGYLAKPLKQSEFINLLTLSDLYK
ncbi:response regulator [Pseudomonas sp. FW306-02-F02-AA]|uniref:Response regulator n=1 Tax=Pseudomonas fluorescens TaxID=294 RepID=A0A0N9VRS6_PSEFL|nr:MULTISPECIES: response regulator [Pseudomonas]ALI03104.1 response regulator [Pseudomonas fluorescens]PMZ04037.1 response regulator [Pseudomonas sp. FW306-02-F02-AB]PMZ10192.1 response regulator [Pseudomonas sp. FW306-02-H06C]PMZ15619.1 response regulator [Pseudomonas sp. FW306-02-F02-AA]PMZ18358.1 response regulator [Pseudomonas sp. FW306-02-F08-AA]